MNYAKKVYCPNCGAVEPGAIGRSRVCGEKNHFVDFAKCIKCGRSWFELNERHKGRWSRKAYLLENEFKRLP